MFLGTQVINLESHLLNLASEKLWHANSWLAQYVESPNMMGQIQQAWSNFVESGQIWALLIGIVLGYLLRNFASFG